MESNDYNHRNDYRNSTMMCGNFLAYGGKEICLFDITVTVNKDSPCINLEISTVFPKCLCRDWIMDVM